MYTIATISANISRAANPCSPYMVFSEISTQYLPAYTTCILVKIQNFLKRFFLFYLCHGQLNLIWQKVGHYFSVLYLCSVDIRVHVCRGVSVHRFNKICTHSKDCSLIEQEGHERRLIECEIMSTVRHSSACGMAFVL